MGLELAKAFLRIRADASALTGDLSRVRQVTEKNLPTSPTIRAQIDSSSFTAGLASMRQGIERFRQAAVAELQGVKTAAAAVLGSFSVAAGGFLRDSINSAAQSEAVMARFTQVFGDQAQAAKVFVDEIASALGRSKTDLLDYTTTFQSFFKGMGFGTKEAQKMSEQITRLGLDLAAFQDISDAEALDRLRSALSGSSEVLDQFGINLKASALEEFLGKSTAKATELEKTAARIALIQKALTDQGAIGIALAEQDQVANRVKQLDAVMKELKTTIGSAVLPIYTSFIAAGTELAGVVGGVVQQWPKAASGMLAGATAASALAAAVAGLSVAFRLLGISMRAAIIGTGIGAAVIAIGAAVGFVIAQFDDWDAVFARNSQKFEEMRALGMEILANLKNAFLDLANAIGHSFGVSIDSVGGFFDFAVNELKNFLDWMSLLSTNWKLTWDLMGVQTALVLTKFLDKTLVIFNTIVGAGQAVGAAIVSAFKDAAYNVGVMFEASVRAIMGLFKGLWQGIKNKFSGGSFLEGFGKAFNEEMAKVQRSMRPIGANAGEAFTEQFVKSMGADSPLKGVIDDLESAKSNITDQMRAERDALRRQREAQRPEPPTPSTDQSPAMAESPPAVAEKPPAPPPATVPAEPLLESGRFGFRAIGTKLQDALLKSEKDQKDDVRNMLLDQSLEVQKQILTATKEGANKPATLT